MEKYGRTNSETILTRIVSELVFPCFSIKACNYPSIEPSWWDSSIRWSWHVSYRKMENYPWDPLPLSRALLGIYMLKQLCCVSCYSCTIYGDQNNCEHQKLRVFIHSKHFVKSPQFLWVLHKTISCDSSLERFQWHSINEGPQQRILWSFYVNNKKYEH